MGSVDQNFALFMGRLASGSRRMRQREGAGAPDGCCCSGAQSSWMCGARPKLELVAAARPEEGAGRPVGAPRSEQGEVGRPRGSQRAEQMRARVRRRSEGGGEGEDAGVELEETTKE